ncbi:GTP-binding protein [Enterococcus ureasiticus]|uniref:CobW family GTP-binding protein n=1 Tax=Enterococcus ureasiticus TaxID=903984 RepID=UPI001A8C02D2|nr:GTP-binding protein [Enterococcus ureasiticus]MBO0474846.1 GTP-binding protein [Enterococcus ureasiticus]
MSIPVTVISGFLGSGKTALINQVLKGTDLASEEVLIIENEFGKKGFDYELLLHSHEKIFQMNGGCICCSLRTDSILAFSAILEVFIDQGYPIKQVIIETSGISDPQPILQTIIATPGIFSHFYLDSVITMVDNVYFERNLFYPEAMKQLAVADRILISEKIDSDIIQRISTINPLADFYLFSLSEKAETIASWVLGIHKFHQEIDRKDELQHSHEEPHQHHNNELEHKFEALHLEGQGAISELILQRWLDWLMLNNPEKIFRIKGFLQISEKEFQVETQGVNQLLQFNMTTRKAKENRNELIIIGQDLNHRNIQQSLEKMQLTSQLGLKS